MQIVFIDDHQMFRDGMISFLSNRNPDWTIESFSNPAEAESSLLKADVIICDLNMPGESGYEFAERLKSEGMKIPLIILTMDDSLESFQKTADLGISAYVTKGSNSMELIRAIESCELGEIYFDQIILKQMLTYFSRGRRKIIIEDHKRITVLSEREREIVNLLVQNDSLDEIADTLSISRKTVENHRSSIYKKLNVGDRLSLVQLFQKSED